MERLDLEHVMTTPLTIRPKTERETIGYVADNIDGPTGEAIWTGIMAAAQQAEVNLFCVAGGRLYQDEIFREYETILYELVNTERMDGLIFWSSSICLSATEEEILQFHQRYEPLPIVTLSKPVARYPLVTTDSVPGTRTLLDHLIRDHGYRRIAFVRGPENHVQAQERYQTYRDVLAAYHLPLDPRLITPPKTWFPDIGIEAGQILLDERHLHPGVDVEAIVCASDNFAIPLITMLQERGVRVPSDLAVVGINDLPEGRCLTPPLTTVAIPLYDQGYRSVEVLLKLLRGEAAPLRTALPSRVIIRESCGCPNASLHQANQPVKRSRTRYASIMETRQQVQGALRRTVAFPAGIEPSVIERLIQAVLAEIYDDTPGIFQQTLEDVLRQVMRVGGSLLEWQDVISALREVVLSQGTGKHLRERVERFVGPAQILIGELAYRSQAAQLMQERKRTLTLRRLSQTLLTTFAIPELITSLTTQLPALGIASCYLAVYENPQPYRYPQPAPEWAQLLLAYVDGIRVPLEADGRRVLTRQIVPDDLWPARRSVALVIQSLHFRDEQIGFVVFEPGPHDGLLYHQLSREISSALQGALLVQRVQARSAELVREQYIFHAFMETLPDMIYFKDRDGRIIRANRAHAWGMGLTDPAEEIGKTYFELLPEALAQFADDEEQQILRTGEPVINRESLITAPDGSPMWSLLTKMPVRDEQGTIIGTFGISRDITRLKKTEAALQEAKDAAEAANRAKSEFLANMSHELRTPLNGILGYAQILQRDPSLSAQQQEGIAIIQHSGEHLLTLINDILDLAKIEARKFDLSLTEFNLLEFLDQIAGIIRMQAQAKYLRFQYMPAPGLPTHIYGDARRLRQVLLNLLGNAVKFTERDGAVMFRISKLETENGKPQPPPGFDQQTSVSIRFEVQDTGVGLTPEQLTLIFRPFEQVGNPLKRTGGTGLGLAISRQLVRLMGSDIQVQSVFGQGSTFWFDLTMSVMLKESHPPPSRKHQIIGYQGRPQRVLIVDNEATNRQVLRDLLQPLGFGCMEAENGREALDRIHAQRPDIILLDLMMPVMNGFEVVQQIRQDPHLLDMVVIAVSASAFEADQARSIAAGCQAFLPKPVESHHLLELLETYLNIEWQYQESDEQRAADTPPAFAPEFSCTPPQQELQHVYTLALKGDLFGLQQYAAALQRHDARVQPFVAELVRLAKTCQDEQLLTFIEHYLEQKT